MEFYTTWNPRILSNLGPGTSVSLPRYFLCCSPSIHHNQHLLEWRPGCCSEDWRPTHQQLKTSRVDNTLPSSGLQKQSWKKFYNSVYRTGKQQTSDSHNRAENFLNEQTGVCYGFYSTYMSVSINQYSSGQKKCHSYRNSVFIDQWKPGSMKPPTLTIEIKELQWDKMLQWLSHSDLTCTIAVVFSTRNAVNWEDVTILSHNLILFTFIMPIGNNFTLGEKAHNNDLLILSHFFHAS